MWSEIIGFSPHWARAPNKNNLGGGESGAPGPRVRSCRKTMVGRRDQSSRVGDSHHEKSGSREELGYNEESPSLVACVC